jgi:hypothetical protein
LSYAVHDKRIEITPQELLQMSTVFDIECSATNAADIEAEALKLLMGMPWKLAHHHAEVVLSMLISHCTHLLVRKSDEPRLLDIPSLRAVIARYSTLAKIPASWATLQDRLASAVATAEIKSSDSKTRSEIAASEMKHFFQEVSDKVDALLRSDKDMEPGVRATLQGISEHFQKTGVLSVQQVEAVLNSWAFAEVKGVLNNAVPFPGLNT